MCISFEVHYLSRCGNVNCLGKKCFLEESNFTACFSALIAAFFFLEYNDGIYSGQLGLKDKINDGTLSLPKLKIFSPSKMSEVFGSAFLFLP